MRWKENRDLRVYSRQVAASWCPKMQQYAQQVDLKSQLTYSCVRRNKNLLKYTHVARLHSQCTSKYTHASQIFLLIVTRGNRKVDFF